MVKGKRELTLKEKRFKIEIQKKENGYNKALCMRKAGYTKTSSNSGVKYRQLRKITEGLDFFNPERIKGDIEETREMAKQEKDITNLNRIDEHRSKIAGLVIDRAQITNKSPDKIIIAYKETTLPPENIETPTINRIPSEDIPISQEGNRELPTRENSLSSGEGK